MSIVILSFPWRFEFSSDFGIIHRLQGPFHDQDGILTDTL